MIKNALASLKNNQMTKHDMEWLNTVSGITHAKFQGFMQEN